MTFQEIKNLFTPDQIKTYNENAKSQGSDNFEKTVKIAVEYGEGKELEIVKFAMNSALGIDWNPDCNGPYLEENEDWKQYS